MLKSNKMKLHLNIFIVIILRNLSKILLAEKTNTHVVIDFYMKRLLPTVSAGT